MTDEDLAFLFDAWGVNSIEELDKKWDEEAQWVQEQQLIDEGCFGQEIPDDFVDF